MANPPKRVKKEETPQPTVELGAAATASVAGAAAFAAADIDAADEDAALRAEQASLAALMEQLAGAYTHAKARHEHITRRLAARRNASAAAEAAPPLSGLAAAAAAGGAAPVLLLTRPIRVPFVAPPDAPPSVARQHAAWDAHMARGGSNWSSSRSIVFTAVPATATDAPAAAPAPAAPMAVEVAPAQPPEAAGEVEVVAAPAPGGVRQCARHDTVTVEDLGRDGASPASASGTPRVRAGLRSGGRREASRE